MTDLIEVKTEDLQGWQLAWAVGKAEGLDVFLVPPQYGNPWRVFARYQASVTEHKHFNQAVEAKGFRHRPQYNCRHTYATMCLMSGMNPAFIAGQLGHSVQVLLSTYAKWLNSANDWAELAKLEANVIGTELVQD